jgi:hypothetical protein
MTLSSYRETFAIGGAGKKRDSNPSGESFRPVTVGSRDLADTTGSEKTIKRKRLGLGITLGLALTEIKAVIICRQDSKSYR